MIDYMRIFTTIFTTVLLAIAVNTIIIAFVFPIFDSINASMTLQNFNYNTFSTMFKAVFLITLNITVITPYVYLIGRVLKKEPVSEDRYIGGYYQ